jgi:hypothetical protein
VARSATTASPAESGLDPEHDLDALARLLDAAAGPALTAELSGEDAARAVFSAHHSASARPSKERRVFSKAILAKTLTAKIAVAVCGVSVVGAATAAATNTLPSGLQSKAHSMGFPAPKDSALKRGTDLSGSQKDAVDGKVPSRPVPTGSSAAKPVNDKGKDQNDQTTLDALPPPAAAGPSACPDSVRLKGVAAPQSRSARQPANAASPNANPATEKPSRGPTY